MTPNPSLDLTYLLPDRLRDDVEVHRSTAAWLEASGKGVNVSRWLARAGVPTTAVLTAGGATGRQLLELLDDEGITHRHIAIAGPTRINTTVLTEGGPTTKVNAPGSPVAVEDLDALVAATAAALAQDAEEGPGVWLAICGSLPPGADAGLVTRLVETAHVRGARCVVDASGAALAAAVAAGADLLAPNLAELAAISDDMDGTTSAAAAFAGQHGCQLLLSMGAGGAIWSDGRDVVHQPAPPIVPVNTAGAGDALLAGWLADHQAPPRQRLERAVRWAVRACLSPTTVATTEPATAQGAPL